MKEKQGWGAIKAFKLLGFNSVKLHATDTTGHIHTENSASMLIKYFVMRKGANLAVDPTTSSPQVDPQTTSWPCQTHRHQLTRPVD